MLKLKFTNIIIAISLIVVLPSFAADVQYQYDNLHRLTRVDRSDGTITVYQYDELGNRTSKVVTTTAAIDYYCDNDTDGYYDSSVDGTCSGANCPPAGCQASQGNDCDDGDALEHPGQTWYADADGDGYSDGTTDTTSCTRPAGYKVSTELTATSGDCDDSYSTVNPGATEGPMGDATCNDGFDNNCDGFTDESDTYCAETASGAIDLPETGQTICYDSIGTVIDCAGTGQDGDSKTGVAWPEPRFTTNADTTITDNLTGLIWAPDGNMMPSRDPGWDNDGTLNDGAVTWLHALDYVAKLNAENYLGHNDWKLPNINELTSLVNADVSYSAIWLNSNGFNNVRSWYWSSTYISSTNNGWTLNMVGAVDYYNNSYYMNVWPVRSGQSGAIQLPQTGQTTSYTTGDDGDTQSGVAWPDPRFTNPDDTSPVNGDCVLDKLTGLVWTKNANISGLKTWTLALDYANNLTLCGYSDWRLPNKKEFASLIDYSKNSPALPTGHPFTNVQSYNYYTSTTYAVETNYAWVITIGNGSVNANIKSSDQNYVWSVRGGEISIDYYCDNDSDGYFNSSIDGTCSGANCPPVGCQATQGNDCNDSNPGSNPAAVELCDSVDNNCDGIIDEGFDNDSDGYTVCGGDCDDSDATINPSATEIPNNGIDEDCDPSTYASVSGSAYNYPEAGFRASISLDISASSLGTSWLNYYYSKLRINLVSTLITGLSVTGNTFTITGEGTVNGVEGYTFTVIITDGNPDSMEIIIYNQDGTIYYASGPGALSGGDFNVVTDNTVIYTLSTVVNPVNSGSVSPDCSAGCQYANNTSATLTANENTGYSFSNWTGCDSPSNNLCTMTMDSDKSITANFQTCMQPVRIDGITPAYYSSLQTAYSAATNGDTIQIQALNFTESLEINKPLILQGGFDCNFTTIIGDTTINGNITINDGIVTLENIVLE